MQFVESGIADAGVALRCVGHLFVHFDVPNKIVHTTIMKIRSLNSFSFAAGVAVGEKYPFRIR